MLLRGLRAGARTAGSPARAFSLTATKKGTKKFDRVEFSRPEEAPHKAELPLEVPQPKKIVDGQEPVCFSINPPGGMRVYYMNRNDEGNPLTADVVSWLTNHLTIANERQETGDLFSVVVRNRTDKNPTSSAPPAFSIGVDPAQLHRMPPAERAELFKQCYQLSGLVTQMTKPVCVWMDGPTHDTAAGIALNSKLRVATEWTTFRVGQAGMGYFPDAGLTHWLPKLDPGLGMYLALTGLPLYGRDVVHAQLANYYINSYAWASVVDCSQESFGHPQTAELLLQDHCHMWAANSRYCFPFSLEQFMGRIKKIFSADSVEEIVSLLEQEAEEPQWAQAALAMMRQNSPLSLVVTHRALTEGRTSTIEECLRREYRLCQRFVDSPDFNEALLARSEGRAPVWSHSSFEEITRDKVESMFQLQPGAGELQLPYLDFDPHYHPALDRVPPSPEWRDEQHDPTSYYDKSAFSSERTS